MIRILIFFSCFKHSNVLIKKNEKNNKNFYVTFPLDRLRRKVTSIYLNQLHSLIKIEINSKAHSATH